MLLKIKWLFSLLVFIHISVMAGEVLNLDKGWRFHKGDISFPVITGHTMTYQSSKAGKSWGAAAPEYDDSDWRVLNLPHDWAVESDFSEEANISQGYRERGYGWYRRNFALSPEDKGKHLELRFDGISTNAVIWVNGTILHRNWCGYTSMHIDITPYVTYGGNLNTIAVRVDANAQEGWWYEGAGIYRHVWLVKRSPVHIKTDGIFANPVKGNDGKWSIPVEVAVNNISHQTVQPNIEVSLYNSNGELIVQQKNSVAVLPLREAVASVNIPVNNPDLWSIDNPVLYTVETKLILDGMVTDKIKTKCGFRTIRFDADSGFYLNDKHLKIKGVCNHQDHAGVGVAVPDALWEFRIRKLKEMGVNAYRCSHNPPSVEFLDVCDSLGILVMDENRHFNTSPEYMEQLSWMVRRDRNRPSIILWSVFNEEPMQGTENGYEMVRRMVDVVKQLDTTRPVTAAMNGGFFTPINVSHAVDVVGFNYQMQNYDSFHEANPLFKLTSSEDISAYQVRGEYKTDKSKNIIDSYDSEGAPWGSTHRAGWKAVSERPYLAGSFVWTGFDYRGEPTPFEWPSVSSYFGIMDLCGFPKMAYYLRQAQWIEDKPVLNLVPHWNWPVDSVGKPIKVMVMSNADSVVLLLNGKIISGQKVDKYEMNTWEVPYQFGKLEAKAFKKGKQVSSFKTETTGIPVSLKLTPYRSILKGDGTDATPITIEAVDSRGRHVPTANLPIELNISGPASIIGVGNGNPCSHEPEKGNKRNLFNGLAQVIIQANENEGVVLLTASSPGVKPVTLKIPVTSSILQPSVPVPESVTIVNKWRATLPSIYPESLLKNVSDNDMNSWEAVFPGTLQSVKKNFYTVWRSKFASPKSVQKQGGTLLLKKVIGLKKIWLNDRLIMENNSPDKTEFRLLIPPVETNLDITILMKSEDSKAGIEDVVTIISNE